MMFPLPYQDIARLRIAVFHALHDAFDNVTESEPQLVANLVWKLPEHLNQIQFTGSTSIKAGGVFVHARPFVSSSSFPSPVPQSVEIGDLLLIRTLVAGKNVKERRALLLQAKKAAHIPTVPNNSNQWHFYEQWPKFEYAKRSGSLAGKVRHVIEPDMYEAAKYLLIGTGAGANQALWMCCPDWPFHSPHPCMHYTAQPTRQALSRYRCFFGDMIEFFAGNSGKSFASPAPGTYGWDQVIHDLIDETANAKTIFMGRAAQQSSKSTRGHGHLFLALADQTNYFLVAGGGGAGDSKGPPYAPEAWGENGGGISTVEVVIEQVGE